MSLQVRLQALIAAIAADIKQIKTDLQDLMTVIDGGAP